MTNLDCTVYGCTYNEKNSCTRGKIQVGGREAIKSSETLCESFQQKSGNTMNHASVNSVKNSTVEASNPTDVFCNAVKCRYNESNKCSASHIRIAGVHAVASGETECGSYEAK